jgi:hypothetical protein
VAHGSTRFASDFSEGAADLAAYVAPIRIEVHARDDAAARVEQKSGLITVSDHIDECAFSSRIH